MTRLRILDDWLLVWWRCNNCSGYADTYFTLWRLTSVDYSFEVSYKNNITSSLICIYFLCNVYIYIYILWHTHWSLHLTAQSLETNQLFSSALSCYVNIWDRRRPAALPPFFGLLVTWDFFITNNDAPQLVGLLLDEWPARHRYLYLNTHKTHNRKTSMLRWDFFVP
jgi:hypothetical protein